MNVLILLIGQGCIHHRLHGKLLLLKLCELIFRNHHFLRCECRGLDENQVGVARETSCQPQERLLELIVALGLHIVVLQVVSSVESDLLGLYFAVLDIHLVPNEHDGDVFADSDEVSVPLGDVLVCDS